MKFPNRRRSIAKSLAYEPIDWLSKVVPEGSRAPQDARGIAPWILLAHGGISGLSRKLEASGVESVVVSESTASSDAVFLEGLSNNYQSMKHAQAELEGDWQPGKDWGPLLEANWKSVRHAMEKGDLASVDSFFREMFRNEAIAGLWGGTGMFERFMEADRWMFACRASHFLHHLDWWRRNYGGPASRLDAAKIGKPWGWKIDGFTVIEPTLEYDGHAQDVLRLVSDVPNPVILEIGGGFGGMARQLVRERPDLTYIGIDLPENAVLQTYYLAHALPGRSVSLHAQEIQPRFEPGSVNLLPNFALRGLASGTVDAVVNFRSFAEFHAEGLDAVFGEIARLGPRWIYQENLSSPRMDGLAGIPMDQQPDLEDYRTVIEVPSPWIRYGAGSPYPCRQKLQERRCRA